MKKAYLGFIAILCGAVLTGCSPGANTTTLGPYQPNFSIPPTTGQTNSGIWFSAGYDANQWTGDYLVNASVSVNGAATTNAAITLITPAGNFEIPEYNWYYYQVLGFSVNYYPGQVYTIQVTTTQGVASASCTMPGPPTLSSDGLELTWPLPSNAGGVIVSKNYSDYSDFFDIWPPYSIPVSAYGYGPGTYIDDVELSWNAYSFVNADPGSKFEITTEPTFNIVK
jgi:hypothetical protein